MEMFEQAIRLKLRFEYKGLVSAEELYDAPIDDMKALYKRLSAKAKQENQEDPWGTKTEADKVLELQVAIVKHIVDVRLEEIDARKKEMDNKATKQKLLQFAQEQQDAHLRSLSPEELIKMAESL